MSIVLLAFGLVLIVEGLAYALAPSLVERALEAIRNLPQTARRQMGALAAVCGLIAVLCARQIGF